MATTSTELARLAQELQKPEAEIMTMAFEAMLVPPSLRFHFFSVSQHHDLSSVICDVLENPTTD